ncbi:class I SAM-dependent methyltransferase [Enterococcus ureilyticus]|uniref:class I SAM-dependent methyltransferase n=1 Tax=Enterococcus ureilyticus TaxID=1131292 RepID=UPI001A90DB49|nr:class I SAM-dependent methyltransferase [Enterococcus ureilyticus]MBO0446322.1 class I SAM-dependent methyltransferase [Enterococcus ureilyticus]
MNIFNQNEKAWDKQVENSTAYTQAVSSESIEQAKNGNWSIIVTTHKPVPRNWFPEDLNGINILCLASGGGQQAPILSAAGANVTVVDISEKQLDKDRVVAKRDHLAIEIQKANMTNLSIFPNSYFDIVINPVSSLFIKDLSPFWKETNRVLKKGGTLITGFTNPILFIFDDEEDLKGNLVVKNKIPYSTLDNLSETEINEFIKSSKTIEFGHTLESQIQGQFDHGFVMNGFYEDDFNGNRPLDKYLKCFIVTKSIKQ